METENSTENPQNINIAFSQIEKPFLYGSTAFWQGKKAAQHVSHKWYIYLRAYENEDLSHFIEKVEFTLHNSFTNPVRGVLIIH